MSDPRHLVTEDDARMMPALFDDPAQPSPGPGPAQYVAPTIRRTPSGDGPAQWNETETV